MVPPPPLNAFAEATASFLRVRDTALPLPGCSILLSVSAAHLTTLSTSPDSDRYPDPPLPNSLPCRQNKMTKDPDTHHIRRSGAGGSLEE